MRYNYARSHSQNDRSLYRLDSLAGWTEAHDLGQLPDGDVLQALLDARNSRFTTTTTPTQTAHFGFRWVSPTVRLNLDLAVRSRSTDMHYRRDRLDTLMTRRWTHALPSARFRYRFSRHERLELRYRTSASAPGMTSLLAVTDDSDPQHISTGNPSLRASWTHSLTAHYNRYDVERQRGWNANLRYNRTARSISTAVTYDEATAYAPRAPKTSTATGMPPPASTSTAPSEPNAASACKAKATWTTETPSATSAPRANSPARKTPTVPSVPASG